LLAAWFGGTREKNPDVCIYTSSNKGNGWSAPVNVADGVESATVRYPTWNPVLFKKDNGDIVLYYKVGPDPKEWWGMYKVSKDNGKTWSAATKIPDGLLGPIKNKPVRLSDSRIMYPTSFETPEKWNIYLETSDQDLKNWKKINIDNATFNSIQPSVLFYKDGAMQLLNRSRNQVVTESWSHDNGKTWSPVAGTTLPNNSSGTDAVTLADGMQLIIYNPTTKGRNKLALAGSYDGKTWKQLLILEDYPDGEFSYPAIIQTKDGKVHLSYTYRRKSVKHVVVDIVKVP
jgi:alpha-L-fucosidase